MTIAGLCPPAPISPDLPPRRYRASDGPGAPKEENGVKAQSKACAGDAGLIARLKPGHVHAKWHLRVILMAGEFPPRVKTLRAGA